MAYHWAGSAPATPACASRANCVAAQFRTVLSTASGAAHTTARSRPNSLVKCVIGVPVVPSAASGTCQSRSPRRAATHRLPDAIAAPDGDGIRNLIKNLNSPTFAVRESASRKLAALGAPVEPFLREALKTGLSAEASERANRLLADLRRPPTPEEIRQRRVIFALETNGSAEARRTLESWAAGAAGAHLTEQSKQALGRIGR